MPALIPQTVTGVNRLLDSLRAKAGYKTDAALARALGRAAPVISKLRSGAMPLGAVILLAAHDLSDISIAELKRLAAAESVISK